MGKFVHQCYSSTMDEPLKHVMREVENGKTLLMINQSAAYQMHAFRDPYVVDVCEGIIPHRTPPHHILSHLACFRIAGEARMPGSYVPDMRFNPDAF